MTNLRSLQGAAPDRLMQCDLLSALVWADLDEPDPDAALALPPASYLAVIASAEADGVRQGKVVVLKDYRYRKKAVA